MKSKLLSAVFIATIAIFGTANAQTIKYKEVYSLIKDNKYDEALPQLNTFLKQEPKHSNANYWAGKIYYQKAVSGKSNSQADSSILFFNKSIENVAAMDLNPINAPRFPDFTGETMVDKMDNGKKFMKGKIDELSGLKTQWENELKAQKERIKQDSINIARKAMQEKWASANTGVNDPMIVAKKYVEAWKNGNIETLLKIGKKDKEEGEDTYRIGMLKSRTIDSYNSDKAKFIEGWKKEVLERWQDMRLTQDYNEKDYPVEEKKENGQCFTRLTKKITEPLVEIKYENEGLVNIRRIACYTVQSTSYCNKNTSNKSKDDLKYSHNGYFDITLIKIEGKWLVKSFGG